MQLRHVGHAMNLLRGPLNQFSTHNFPDTYSPMMKLLHDAERGLPRQEEPTMPTLQEMHTHARRPRFQQRLLAPAHGIG